jgi:hypothetical protein
MNNFVVNVGHIANECHVIASSGEPTPDNVKGYAATNMTNMRRGLNRGTTQVYANLATLKGNKIPHGAR